MRSWLTMLLHFSSDLPFQHMRENSNSLKNSTVSLNNFVQSRWPNHQQKWKAISMDLKNRRVRIPRVGGLSIETKQEKVSNVARSSLPKFQLLTVTLILKIFNQLIGTLFGLKTRLLLILKLVGASNSVH